MWGALDGGKGIRGREMGVAIDCNFILIMVDNHAKVSNEKE